MKSCLFLVIPFLALFCAPAAAQIDSSPLGDLKIPLEGDTDSPKDAPIKFDILDMPENLFNRPRPPRPRTKLPPLQLDRDWDYRFDVQYQSTIRPYMRWYMRENPRRPRSRYLSDEYRAGRYGFHASARGYSAYTLPNDPYGFPISPVNQGMYGSVRYWDHLNWLFHEYNQLPIDRSFTVTGRLAPGAPIPFDIDSLKPKNVGEPSNEESMEAEAPAGVVPAAGAAVTDAAKTKAEAILPDLFSRQKPSVMKELRRQQIWVGRHQASGHISVLYTKPAQTSAVPFYEAQTAMTGPYSILALKWVTKPEWSAKVHLKAGRLKNIPDSAKNSLVATP